MYVVALTHLKEIKESKAYRGFRLQLLIRLFDKKTDKERKKPVCGTGGEDQSEVTKVKRKNLHKL